MKNLKFFFLGTLLCSGMLLFNACVFDDDDSEELVGNWVRKSDYEGVTRSEGVAFVIGDLAFAGLGYDGDDDLLDFWQYDPALDFWTRVDTFPGIARRGAVAFSANGKGYVGTGYSGDLDEELNDFWEFDPNAAPGEQWRRVADFLGSARYNAVAFGLNDKGYVGTGYDGNWLKDFYEYDPGTDEWIQIVSLGGSKREDAVAFVIGDRAYVATGRNNGIYEMDFWEFDGTNKTWTPRLDIDDDDDYTVARHTAVGFSLNGYGYVATGSTGTSTRTIWQYDPTSDLWEQKTSLEGSARTGAVGFTVSGRSFLTTGSSGGTRLDDLWEFRPDEELDEDD
ncbi:MAG: galactose oxidase [Bacteroidota bacterium]